MRRLEVERHLQHRRRADAQVRRLARAEARARAWRVCLPLHARELLQRLIKRSSGKDGSESDEAERRCTTLMPARLEGQT